MTAIDADLDPRGEDSMLSTRMILNLAWIPGRARPDDVKHPKHGENRRRQKFKQQSCRVRNSAHARLGLQPVAQDVETQLRLKVVHSRELWERPHT